MAILAWSFMYRRGRATRQEGQAAAERGASLARETRGFVVVVAGPLGVGIARGYVAAEYWLPLALFVITGMLVADLMTAVRGRRDHRG